MCRFIWFITFPIVGHFILVDSANILYLAPIPSPSHGLWNFKIVEALAARGHNLTVLSVDKPKIPINNTYIIGMEAVYDILYNEEELDLSTLMTTEWKTIPVMADVFESSCEAIGKTDGFKALLNYPDDFKVDLIVNDFSLYNCLLGFLHKFNYPPMIGVSPYKYSLQLADMMGGHYYAGYIPGPTLPFGTDMTFMQRLENIAILIYDKLYRKFISMPKIDKVQRKLFKIKNLPSLQDLERKHSLALVNIHPATDFPVPLAPNIIEVGGLQIAEPKPLPADIKNFIEKAKSGAVLISFGTNVKKNIFSEKRQKMLMTVVKKFPNYNFLWKFEEDVSKGKIPNLLVKQWMPQNDILAHPNLKAFVSHGGGLSTHEATWHAVPIVAVPFFMDQYTNSHGCYLAGVAIKVDILTMTAQDLEDAIRTILEDASYSERMKLRSSRFRDRPMKPLDTAVWWIEYMLRNPNPTHLQSPLLQMGQWKANLYDILLYGIILIIITAFIILKAICKITALFCVKDNRKEKTKIN